MLHVSLSSVFSLIVQFYQLGFLTHLAFWLFFKVYWFDKTELQVKRLTNQKNMICYDDLVLNFDCFFNTRHQFQHSTPCPNDMIDTSKAFLNMTKSTNFFLLFFRSKWHYLCSNYRDPTAWNGHGPRHCPVQCWRGRLY